MIIMIIIIIIIRKTTDDDDVYYVLKGRQIVSESSNTNRDLRIEVIRESFSTKLKSILEVIGVLFFILPYTALIVYFGFDFVSRSYQMNEVASALTGLSHRWIINAFVPMGMAFLWLAGISVLLRNLAYLIGVKKHDDLIIETSQSMSPELSSAAEELIKEANAEERK